MTARKILIAMSILMFASACWGQYSTTVTQGATNITSYLPTTNAWKALPASVAFNHPAFAADGSVYFLDSSGCPWKYDLPSQAYTKQTAMGCQAGTGGLKGLAAGDFSDIYIIATDSSCGTPATDIWKWQPATSTWARIGFCGSLLKVTAGSDGTAGVLRSDGSIWTNQVPLWSQISGTGYLDISIYSTSSMCAVHSVHVGKGWGNGVWTWNGSAFVALAAQPSGVLTTSGCTMGRNTIVAWGPTWLSIYDLASQTWTNVSGLSTFSGVSAFSLGTILALDSGGHPYHLNAIAPYTSAQLSGSFTGCPTDTQPCPPSGVTHEKQIRVQYPGGLGGAMGDHVGSPTDTTVVSSLDFTAGCDLLFGNPTDPACHPNVTGAVLCSVVGSSIYTPSYIPCYIGIWRPDPVDNISIPKPWPTGATIHVYFDGTYWPSGACPTPAYCKFFTGVSSWTGATPSANLHYQNMGVIPGGCPTGWPCGMQYPFIYVSGAVGGSSQNRGMQSTGTGHQWDIIGVLLSVIAANDTHELQMTGAHEEGHNQMLDDCHPGAPPGTPGWQCTASDQSKTVMWWVGDPSNPVSPMPCDMDWATIYRYIF
jgi:hypothetical protein